MGVMSVNSQVRLVSTSNTSVNSSAFIDASSVNSNNITVGKGKGLVFPRVDLTTFQFVSGTTGIGSSFPTRYDGMLVYNTGTGNTLSMASDNVVAVTPGFWYYDNKSTTLKGGTWKPLNSSNNLTGAIVTTGNTTSLGSFSSTELATALTDETGTGSVVLATSPSLTGTPTVPTASSGDSSSQIANTEFVANAVKNRLSIKTSDYTLNSQDYTVLCNASSATISLTLPSPSESTDKIIIIKKIDTSYNQITFSPSVYLTESQTAISINYPKTIKIQSNGTNWYVIN
jgi:hypothetical protein